MGEHKVGKHEVSGHEVGKGTRRITTGWKG